MLDGVSGRYSWMVFNGFQVRHGTGLDCHEYYVTRLNICHRILYASRALDENLLSNYVYTYTCVCVCVYETSLIIRSSATTGGGKRNELGIYGPKNEKWYLILFFSYPARKETRYLIKMYAFQLQKYNYI